MADVRRPRHGRLARVFLSVDLYILTRKKELYDNEVPSPGSPDRGCGLLLVSVVHVGIGTPDEESENLLFAY